MPAEKTGWWFAFRVRTHVYLMVIIAGMTAVIGMMLAFLSFGGSARAQSDNCSSITKYGVFNTEKTFSSRDHFELVKKFLCLSEATTLEQLKQEGSNLGIGVGIYSLKFGGESSSSNFMAWKKNSCASDYSQIQDSSTHTGEVSIASEAITKAWTSCISRNGLRAWLAPGAAPEKFYFRARYSDESERPLAKVHRWMYDKSITCVPATLKEIGNSGITALCTRSPNAAVDMALNTDRGSRQLQLWAAPKLQPVGPAQTAQPPLHIDIKNSDPLCAEPGWRRYTEPYACHFLFYRQSSPAQAAPTYQVSIGGRAILNAELQLEAALADHYNLPTPYCVDIRINGNSIGDPVPLSGVPHGAPYASAFTNFAQWRHELPGSALQYLRNGTNTVAYTIVGAGSDCKQELPGNTWVVFRWSALAVTVR